MTKHQPGEPTEERADEMAERLYQDPMNDGPLEENKSEWCDSCSWSTPELFEHHLRDIVLDATGRRVPNESVWLCEVCSSTDAGNAFLYPMNHVDNAEVLRTIAYGINYLSAQISRMGQK